MQHQVISLTEAQLSDPEIQGQMNYLGHEFIAEAGYPVPFRPDHFYPFWVTLRRLDIGRFFIVTDSEVPVGVMGCIFTPDSFSGEPAGLEHFWFVTKSARGAGRLGLRLFNEFEKECQARGCKLQVMAHLDGLRGAALGGLYERRGYSPAERFYRKVN